VSIAEPILLGVNVDHVATLRQARGTSYPDPLSAALLAEQSGADSITVHLREDRRHIVDQDIELMVKNIQSRVNLEMAVTDEMLSIACEIKPSDCCLVPERRAELTTEGGLDVISQRSKIAVACQRLQKSGIRVSLFVDPEPEQLDASLECGAGAIELHTGKYADAIGEEVRAAELERIRLGAAYADKLGMAVHAGHGLHYENVQPVASIPQIIELNIGHSIIAEAVFEGLARAVARMKALMLEAGRS